MPPPRLPPPERNGLTPSGSSRLRPPPPPKPPPNPPPPPPPPPPNIPRPNWARATPAGARSTTVTVAAIPNCLHQDRCVVMVSSLLHERSGGPASLTHAFPVSSPVVPHDIPKRTQHECN